jgi:hypothetical protein
MDAPQINAGKNPQQPLNLSQLLPLPSDTPFGNFFLKYLKIVNRIDRINLLTQDIFLSFFSLAHQSEGGSEDFFQHQIITEEVIYWLRKTADELISMQYILHVQEQTGQFPNKIEVDCIGLLNHENAQDFKQNFLVHLKFLNTLNEVSNAYKHSFINSELSLIGAEEPYVFALALKQNDLGKQPMFHEVPFAALVVEFDNFFQSSVEQLRKCKLPHLSTPEL